MYIYIYNTGTDNGGDVPCFNNISNNKKTASQIKNGKRKLKKYRKSYIYIYVPITNQIKKKHEYK